MTLTIYSFFDNFLLAINCQNWQAQFLIMKQYLSCSRFPISSPTLKHKHLSSTAHKFKIACSTQNLPLQRIINSFLNDITPVPLQNTLNTYLNSFQIPKSYTTRKRQYVKMKLDSINYGIRENKLDEHFINETILKLSEGSLDMPNSNCLKCTQFFFEGTYIPLFCKTSQICYLTNFKDNYQEILHEIIAIGNCNGVLLMCEQNPGQQRQIHGKALTQNQKKSILQLLREKTIYLMPQNARDKLCMKFIPFKQNLFANNCKNDAIFSGKYALKIYFRGQNVGSILFNNFKGGKLKDNSRSEIYRIENYKVVKIKANDIFQFCISQRGLSKAIKIPYHYGQPCESVSQENSSPPSSPSLDISPQKKQYIPAQFTNLKKKCLFICKKKSAGIIQNKIKACLNKKKIKFYFQQKNSDIEHTQNRSIITILHQDKFIEISNLIKDVDPTKQIQLQKVTTIILLEQQKNQFSEKQKLLKQTIAEKYPGKISFERCDKICMEYTVSIEGNKEVRNENKSVVVLRSKTLLFSDFLFGEIYFGMPMSRKLRFIDENCLKERREMSHLVQEEKWL